jgi:hypothetical protein
LTIAIESKKIIEKMQDHEPNYSNEIATLSQDLEEKQTTKKSTEESFALELPKVKESCDRVFEVAKELDIKTIMCL